MIRKMNDIFLISVKNVMEIWGYYIESIICFK